MSGIEDIEGLERTDALEDFRVPVELQYRDECIENAEKISLEELRSMNPDIAAYIDRMNERLGNDYQDGFMNTLEVYKDGDTYFLRSSDPQYENSYIVIKNDDVYCYGGCLKDDQHPNEFINESVLMPNKTYHVDGCINYRTDELGRVVVQTNKIEELGDIDRHGARGNLKPIADSKDGRPDDIGGHLVANNVNGPTEAINIIPQDRVLNNCQDWKNLEKEIQNAVFEGKRGTVTRTLEYEGDSFRPKSIIVTVQIEGQEPRQYKFNN